MIQRNQFYKASVLVGLMIAGANMLANDSMGSSVMHVHSLVIIKNVIPNIVVDLKYATALSINCGSPDGYKRFLA